MLGGLAVAFACASCQTHGSGKAASEHVPLNAKEVRTAFEANGLRLVVFRSEKQGLTDHAGDSLEAIFFSPDPDLARGTEIHILIFKSEPAVRLYGTRDAIAKPVNIWRIGNVVIYASRKLEAPRAKAFQSVLETLRREKAG